MKQTAVEWLVEQLKTKYDINIERLSVTDKAKAMEKQQIIETWHEGYDNESPMKDEENCGQQYYNEKFGSHNSKNNSD